MQGFICKTSSPLFILPATSSVQGQWRVSMAKGVRKLWVAPRRWGVCRAVTPIRKAGQIVRATPEHRLCSADFLVIL